MTVNSTGTVTATWNGPVCQRCWEPYLGSHSCSREAIQRRIDELTRLMDLPASSPADRTRTCPCRPENGGSGVCGCTLGGPSITC